MQKRRLSIVVPLALVLAVPATCGMVMAQSQEEMGRLHFTDPRFAGGQRACNDCHANGRGLEKAGTKTKFTIMGGEQNSLEEAINACITNAINGKAIPEDSKEMKEMVSYIKSLGGKAASGQGR